MSLINSKIHKITNYKLFGDLKEGDPIHIYLKDDKIFEFCFNVMTIENLKNLDQIGCLTSLQIEDFNDWENLLLFHLIVIQN